MSATASLGAGPAATETDLTGEWASLLIQALRQLHEAGDTEPACRLAARGWQLARRTGHPAAARFNGLLHHLTRETG